MINREQAEMTVGFLTPDENDREMALFPVMFVLPDTAPPGELHLMNWT